MLPSATYETLEVDESDMEDEQSMLGPDFPKQKAILGVTLFIMGIVLVIIGIVMLITGNAKSSWGFLIFGIIVFIPGFHSTRILYYTWKKVPGYSYEMLNNVR